ncbi:MAG: mercury methylation corrinoid protein HgcA [Candidatus Aminicenantales bacterium]
MRASTPWITGSVATPGGDVPRVTTALSFGDRWGTWKARWGIGRMKYAIPPGLYAVGHPDARSPVLVTANYKMSFDRLRRELGGLDAWILVLNTHGVNVWCSAGKGTFGTEEVVRRVEKAELDKVVDHRTLILPQLSAPGVAAHEVKKRSGFRVIYGPVRAREIPAFLESGFQATPRMRTVTFGLRDRIVLAPVEIMGALKPALILLAAVLLLHAAGVAVFSAALLTVLLGTILAGTVVVPALLPWIPGRSFALKGWLIGLLWTLAVNVRYGLMFSGTPSWKSSLVNFLILPPIVSFIALNFTGSSTYTSLSGVIREMKVAIPLILVSVGFGIAFWVAKIFIAF